MKNISKYSLLSIFGLLFFSACTKDEDEIPNIALTEFLEPFENADHWVLLADTIRKPGADVPQTAKIEQGCLDLYSKQDGGCGLATAIHYFDVKKSLGEENLFSVVLDCKSFYCSTWGMVEVIINYDGMDYVCRLLGRMSQPGKLTFTFDGKQLLPDENFAAENPELSIRSGESQTSSDYPNSFRIVADGCGPDNFHQASITMHSMQRIIYRN